MSYPLWGSFFGDREMKKCTKCGEEKQLVEFSIDKRLKVGRKSQCKACQKQYYQANREKIAERKKQYEQANREKIAEQKKQYRQENREKIAERNRQHYQENREKIAEQKKQYHQENREQILGQKKQYYQENREKLAEKNKQYYQANREKIAEQQKQYYQQYYQENREKFKARSQKRRARKRNAAGNATAAEIQARFDYHGNQCYYCGCDGKMTIEHRIPLSRGGTHWPANIVPACERCNKSKGVKTEKEFNKPA